MCSINLTYFVISSAAERSFKLVWQQWLGLFIPKIPPQGRDDGRVSKKITSTSHVLSLYRQSPNYSKLVVRFYTVLKPISSSRAQPRDLLNLYDNNGWAIHSKDPSTRSGRKSKQKNYFNFSRTVASSTKPKLSQTNFSFL